MADSTTENLVKAIIEKHNLKGEPLEIGGEWCLLMPDAAEARQICETFGVSGHQSANGFIVCNLKTQPYNPQIRF